MDPEPEPEAYFLLVHRSSKLMARIIGRVIMGGIEPSAKNELRRKSSLRGREGRPGAYGPSIQPLTI